MLKVGGRVYVFRSITISRLGDLTERQYLPELAIAQRSAGLNFRAASL